jgi:hypothetical protein
MPLLLAGISERMIRTQKVRTTLFPKSGTQNFAPGLSALLELDLAHPVKGWKGYSTPLDHTITQQEVNATRLTIDELEC